MPLNHFQTMFQAGVAPVQAHQQGQQAGVQMHEAQMRNRLLQREMQQQDTTQNMLAQLTMSGSPEEREVAFNALLAQDPAVAQQVLATERAQAENRMIERQMQQESAREAIARMQYVLEAESPAMALQLASLDSSGEDLIELLAAHGVIDPDDGIDDNEARIIASEIIRASQPLLAPPDERSEPSLIREMRAVGIDPDSDEGRETWLNMKMREGASDQEMEQLRLQLTQMQVEDRRRERLQEERTEQEQRAAAQSSVTRGLRNIEQLIGYNDDLRGTFLQAGIPGTDLRRMSQSTFAGALRFMGRDASQREEEIRKFDQLRKGLDDLIIETLDRFGGTITNSQLQLLQNASANMDISPDAINAILADVAEIYLEQADRQGFEVRDRERYEKLIARVRGSGGLSFETMTVEELEALDPREMTPAQRAAAAQRWFELEDADEDD